MGSLLGYSPSPRYFFAHVYAAAQDDIIQTFVKTKQPLDGGRIGCPEDRDGLAGAMGELLCAIEEDREPSNSTSHNLKSLELCFAAVASADRGAPAIPGEALTITY